MPKFHYANSSDPVPGDGNNLPSQFTINVPSQTDIWTKPPTTTRFNAPILYRPIPISSFQRMRVNFTANWEHQYDQGGLIFVLNGTDGSRKWIKTGIELVDGRPRLSTVTCDRAADWSLVSVPEGTRGATVEAVRAKDDSLWIYLVEDGEQRSPLREVTWALEETGVRDLWVGVFGARPSAEGGDLVVGFRDFVLDLV
ncbi:uncharacterized protein BDW47DRAFT_110312 [Aspergillus candidus]|uniref:Concanavalin A-like lectin/glucanase domain-containing protein n=1 Tax=Aspergillus candidus TaxID=41067 RepID=A0A2I2F4J8_ASPCN|nr:hypothetical protein BDW47DRAFT_110312 [Aspergillus candidus]PLB35563.1 hypothetical protein BDW47DRAFT_110312 [Aspergillus candidus]